MDGEVFNLWDDIIKGVKKCEYREANEYWLKRLPIGSVENLRAWFMVGYPKNNLPRIEADITEIIHHKYIGIIEIKFQNILKIESQNCAHPPNL